MVSRKQRQSQSIVLLCTQYERGGAQKVAQELALHLHTCGYKVHLCFLYDKIGELEQVRRRAPFAVIDLGARGTTRRWLNPLRAVRAFGRLFTLLRGQRIETLLTFQYYSNVFGPLIGRLAGVPVRISSQRTSYASHSPLLLRLDGMVVNSALIDYMAPVSDATRRFCIEREGMRPDKLRTIPNGVDLQRFDRRRWDAATLTQLRAELNIPAAAPLILTVGRLHPQKGHSYLIEAATQVLAAHPTAVFVFVGAGQLRDTLAQAIAARNLTANIRLLGERDDIPQLLAISDLFVLPSLFEGMPNVVLEAMATQVPVIATAVDGTVSLINDGKNGLLIPPRDSAALGAAITRVLDDPAFRSRIADAGLQHVTANFALEQSSERFRSLIDEVRARKGLTELRV